MLKFVINFLAINDVRVVIYVHRKKMINNNYNNNSCDHKEKQTVEKNSFRSRKKERTKQRKAKKRPEEGVKKNIV